MNKGGALAQKTYHMLPASLCSPTEIRGILSVRGIHADLTACLRRNKCSSFRYLFKDQVLAKVAIQS